METVFKVGMKVYDYTYGKGEVIEIQNYRRFDNILLVKFENRDNFIKYSLDGRIINYKTCGGDLNPENLATNPTLSTSPYTLQGFEQKEPAKTYEEALKWCIGNLKDYRECVCTEYVNEKQENALEALRKLLVLRDYYNEGWQPDWTDESYKEILCFETDFHNKKGFKYRFYASKSQPRVLAFKNSEIRERFFKEQKELLEIAKPLL